MAELFVAKADRWGGMEVAVPESSAGGSVERFGEELRKGLASWRADGKRGIWAKVPALCARFQEPLIAEGFAYHHAKNGYAMLIKWCGDGPSELPKYAFTRIGVGGVVLNSKDEVLMVQERISPHPASQDMWKLPGGLSLQGEDFKDTVLRELEEETGITASLIGIVSMRHVHDFPHTQSDIYVLIKLRAATEDVTICEAELKDAQWMSKAQIQSLVVEAGQPVQNKVNSNNWAMIKNALEEDHIVGTEIPNSVVGKKSTFLYTVPKKKNDPPSQEVDKKQDSKKKPSKEVDSDKVCN